jgi:hypothetical protein
MVQTLEKGGRVVGIAVTRFLPGFPTRIKEKGLHQELADGLRKPRAVDEL